MPFQPVLMFGVVRSGGAEPTVLQVRETLTVTYNGIVPGMDGAIGVTRQIDDAASQVFEISSGNKAGPVITATLTFNWTTFEALEAADRDALIALLEDGGRKVLQVQITGLAALQTLPVELRALKTSDFRLNNNVALPAYHAGGANPNLVVPAGDAVANYSYSTPGGELGAGALVASANGELTLSVASAPLDAATRNIQLQVDAVNVPSVLGGASPAVGAATTVNGSAQLAIDLHVPGDVVVMLDRSGSMNRINPLTGVSKWATAHSVAQLFTSVYGQLLPHLSTANGSLAAENTIAFGRFFWSGGDQTAVDAAVPATPIPAVPPQAPGGLTPIGIAIKKAADSFGAGSPWRRRHIVLLTDGMSNVPAVSTVAEPRLDDINTAGGVGFVPHAAGDAMTGITLHSIDYALTGETHAVDQQALAETVYGGKYHHSAMDADPLGSAALREMFLDILGDVLPVERLDVASGSVTIPLEDGIERALFVCPTGGGISASHGGGQSTTALPDVHGFSLAEITSPNPGPWTVAASGDAFVLVDLALRMQVGVEKVAVGKPMKVWAQLSQHGRAIEQADVRVGISRPGESVGVLTTSFTRSGGIRKAIARGYINPKDLRTQATPFVATPPAAATVSPSLASVVVDRLTISAAAASLGTNSPNDPRSLQATLLRAAEASRNLDYKIDSESLTLAHVGNGRYEATLGPQGTQNEGIYTFRFRADGVTARGHAFGRNKRTTTVLAPLPDGATSDQLVDSIKVGDKIQHTVTILPRTATKTPLGPGLGYAVGFHHLSEKDRTRLPPPVTIDHLDGTYSTTIELPADQALPSLGFFYGPPGKRGEQALVPIDSAGSKFKSIKVVLQRIQILDDKDGCLAGKGELAFDTLVAPNENPNRAVRRRFPEEGTYKLRDGDVLELNEVIYEGKVEPESRLSVSIGGRDFDFLLFLTREEPLSRYHRSVALKTGRQAFTPDDEPNDPESLADWKVWYTVEVS